MGVVCDEQLCVRTTFCVCSSACFMSFSSLNNHCAFHVTLEQHYIMRWHEVCATVTMQPPFPVHMYIHRWEHTPAQRRDLNLDWSGLWSSSLAPPLCFLNSKLSPQKGITPGTSPAKKLLPQDCFLIGPCVYIHACVRAYVCVCLCLCVHAMMCVCGCGWSPPPQRVQVLSHSSTGLTSLCSIFMTS